jgi:hypothetical protein
MKDIIRTLAKDNKIFQRFYLGPDANIYVIYTEPGSRKENSAEFNDNFTFTIRSVNLMTKYLGNLLINL